MNEQATPAIGTAEWSLPRAWKDAFPVEGTHLERHASLFHGVEINSSFYRQHKRATYARWAASVSTDFRFAVKLPRAITHDQALIASEVLLDVFLEEVTALGDRLGPLLVQLSPSLAFDPGVADEFYTVLRGLHTGEVVCEPRHASWFDASAAALLERRRVARVTADPARVPAAAHPGGWDGLAYFRLHGSPRMYYSAYPADYLAMIAATLRNIGRQPVVQWCIFDNTTLGAATGNALVLQRLLGGASCADGPADRW